MEEAPLEVIPSFAPLPKKRINKRFIYLSFAILLIVLIFLGFMYLSSNKKNTIDQEAAVTTPTQAPTETPVLTSSISPTPSVTSTLTPKPTVNPVDKVMSLDRSKLSITVENGSGETGAASKASDVLKNLGYNVIAIANADNSNYSNVTIQVKSSNSKFLDLLKKDLGFTYTIGTTSANLSDGFSSDAVVIIGK